MGHLNLGVAALHEGDFYTARQQLNALQDSVPVVPDAVERFEKSLNAISPASAAGAVGNAKAQAGLTHILGFGQEEPRRRKGREEKPRRKSKARLPSRPFFAPFAPSRLVLSHDQE